MQFSASVVAIISLAASAMATPIEARGLSASVTLCAEPNLQQCSVASVPIGTCYDATAFRVLSVANKDHTCAYHTEPGCKGTDKHYRGQHESLPADECIQSVRCW